MDTVLGRVRSASREVSSHRFLQFAAASLFALYVVVTSGALVRLTASGLGCDNWPLCGNRPYPEKGGHAAIEFGNRMVAIAGILLTLLTWLASRRVRELSPRVRLLALLTFAGTVAQIPLGGITVLLDLHPVAVMSHFLLALLVLAAAVIVAVEAWSADRGLAPAARSGVVRAIAAVGVAACAVLVVTGSVATAAGPHSGGEDIRRLGLAITDTVYVHVRATAVYGVVLLIVAAYLVTLRSVFPGVFRVALALFAVLVVQMVVGEVQYRNALPWGLVLVHVALAGTIWMLTVFVAYTLWRPPAPLAGPPRRDPG